MRMMKMMRREEGDDADADAGIEDADDGDDDGYDHVPDNGDEASREEDARAWCQSLPVAASS